MKFLTVIVACMILVFFTLVAWELKPLLTSQPHHRFLYELVFKDLGMKNYCLSILH